MANLPIIAVIPNYNMATQLEKLLPTLINQGYQTIYVLDDCSTDNSEEIVRRFKYDGVVFVSNNINIGAGPNRNRIMKYEKYCIAHFLDADMELIDKNQTIEDIKDSFKRHPDASVIGFRVLNPNMTQFEWNFGPIRQFKDSLIWHSWNIKNHSKIELLNLFLTKIFNRQWQNWWTYMHPTDAKIEHQVGVVVECNMAVNLSDFNEVQGFENKLRFHEIHALALKLRSIDKTIWYVPKVEAIKHDGIEVRSNRKREIRLATLMLDFKRITGQFKLK